MFQILLSLLFSSHFTYLFEERESFDINLLKLAGIFYLTDYDLLQSFSVMFSGKGF